MDTNGPARRARIDQPHVLIDQLWEDQRTATSFFGMARQLTPLLERISPRERGRLLRRRDREEDDNHALLRVLGEGGNLLLLFGGYTPANEDREFVFGNPNSSLRQALVVLGQYPFNGDFSVPGLEVYLLETRAGAYGDPSWTYQQLTPALVEVLTQKTELPEEEAEDED